MHMHTSIGLLKENTSESFQLVMFQMLIVNRKEDTFNF